MAIFVTKPTNWMLEAGPRLVKATVRVHNLEAIEEDTAVLFAFNRFTRLEALLLPYVLRDNTSEELTTLVGEEMFAGQIGRFLRTTILTATEDPDRDKVIVRSLLTGDHPWLMFPPSATSRGDQRISPQGALPCRAATLALRAEFYRTKLTHPHHNASDRPPDALLEQFGLDAPDAPLAKRTVIIPVNLTYCPLRPSPNLFLRLARTLAKDPSPRAIDEQSVQGTVLDAGTDIDITLGQPMDAREYLDQPENDPLIACRPEVFDRMEREPESPIADAARRLTSALASAIDSLTPINAEHIWAALLRHQWSPRFTDRAFRNRAALCVRQIMARGDAHVHPALAEIHREILSGEPVPVFTSFMSRCMQEGRIQKNGRSYYRTSNAPPPKSALRAARDQKYTNAIADEVEAVAPVARRIRRIAHMPVFFVSRSLRKILLAEELRLFEDDYAQHYEKDVSKPPEVGRPLLLLPWRVKAGVILIHGYMAAPLEVRALAEFLRRRGYAVYAVRLKGHGTAPTDLARTQWEDWCASIDRAYAITETVTDRIVLGGFSMGAGLALLAAGRKSTNLHAVFAINAPLLLRSTAARFAPSVVRVNTLLQKLHWKQYQWEYVENDPENKHINYPSNPVRGVAQLTEAMEAMSQGLMDITAPALIVQGSRDPTVHPDSGMAIFEKVGTPKKELAVFERANHGIINGLGAEDIFERVYRFLLWADKKGRGQ